MPEITSCPDCEKKLRVPDDLIGKKVRCPGCGVMFLAQAGVGLPEEPARASARSLADQEPSRDRPPPDRDVDRDSGRRSRSDAYSDRAPDPRARDYDDRPLPRRRDDREEDRYRGRDDDYDRDRRRRDDYDEDRDRGRRRRDDDYDDRPPPRPRDLVRAWRGVRMGLNLVIISGWLGVAMWGILVIGFGLFLIAGISMLNAVIASQSNAAGTATQGAVAMGLGVILFMLVIGLVALAEVVLRLVGYGLCLQVPSGRNSSSKALAIATFSCAAAAVFFNWVGVGMGFGTVGFRGAGPMLMMSGVQNMFGWLSSLLAFAGFICWLIFLRCVAVQLRNSDVARRVIVFLICDLVFLAVAFMMAIVIFAVIFASSFGAIGAMAGGSAQGAFRSMGAGIIISILLGSMIFLGYLAMQVWHIFVVMQVRDVVDRQLAKL